jgi:hypothetical protein
VTTVTVTLDDIALVVGAVCCFELGLAYRRSPAAAALVDALERDNHGLDGALDVLGWQVAAHFESLFRAAGEV